MSNRIKIHEVNSAAYKAMFNLEGFIEKSGLTKIHKELIKIRASQLNGCAYCINMHTIDARKAGETEQRIYALNAWQETPFFDDQERAILALTEEVTMISNRVSDETYRKAAELLGEQYLSEVIMAIVIINAWNRIGVTTALTPEL
ncbi:hypothetical protein PBAL39_10860 [Pedobacter sp. BAL39]|uniref:carboxymuconolactone decarboxylase family protein n=1 Tax=Pedobacter sp. BAL39 TaxID=391596 RepID=UPI000155A3A2|nr:carboxymuconolactone decarboxylase family protein [Pedobacter sp. BAL39]EDM34492.1 hypothetical protein PBAL39_10860 [Pedobacter sp. BAL39]